MITFDELIKQHEELWKDTNFDQQEAKWKEEYGEFMDALEATNAQLYELADMFIVSAGIARFDYVEGLNYLYDTLESLFHTVWGIEGLLNAVEEKMAKNRSRKWVKKDDVGYHHTEE